jgi:outer membrane lipoprotein-sorting protein
MGHGSVYGGAGRLRFASIWLLSGLLLLHGVAAAAAPPGFASILAGMKAKMAATNDYHCRLETQSARGDASRNEVLAYFYRRPTRIRMEVLEGPYSGSLLIYNGEIDATKVRVLAGNRLVAFLQRMIYGEYFAVDHEWVVDLRDNGIHESHWPHFIRTHENYLHLGTTSFLREEILNGHKTYVYRLVSHDPAKTMNIKAEDVWVDAESYFPVKYVQYDESGQLVRKAVVTELQFNTGISEKLFTEFHPDTGADNF